MYKVDVPLDMKESSAIERRRNMESARKSRIFEAKQRTIGVDISSLDRQVKEENERQADESRHHAAYASMMVRNDTKAQLLDKRNERTRNQICQELKDFRTLEQPKQSRREWDLNDPDVLKNADILGQNEHGMSSLQSFVGEDSHHNRRVEMQKEQIREWSLALQGERAQAEADRQLQDRLYDLNRVQLDHTAQQIEADQNKAREQQVKATKDFNRRLAEEQNLNREASRNATLSQNMTEIRNQVLGDVLTENPDVARSAFGLHRVIPDRWKGMSEQELSNVRHNQEAQRLENIKKNDEEKERQDEWNLQQIASAKAGILLDREQERRKKELRKHLDRENAELAKEQDKARKNLDQMVYTNIPSEAYYSQFNTTTR